MTALRRLSCLRRDTRGAAMVEFAILAPVIFGMMLGVLQIGVQMFSYNVLRSVAADTVRYTMIEYQKEDKLIAEQVETKAVAFATTPPYSLNANLLDATVTTPTTDINGMKKFQLVLTYTPPNVLGVLRVGGLTMTWTRVFYVTAT